MQIALDESIRKIIFPETKPGNECPEKFVSYLQPEKMDPAEKENSKRIENDGNEEKVINGKQDRAQESPEEGKNITKNSALQNDGPPKEEIAQVLKNQLQQYDIQPKSPGPAIEQTGISILNGEMNTKAFKTLQAEAVYAEPKIEISAFALQKMEIKPIDRKPAELLITDNKLQEKNEPVTSKSQQPPIGKDHGQIQEKRESTADVKPDQRPKLFLEKETGPLPVQFQGESATPVRIYFIQPASAGDHSALQQKILNVVQNAIQFLWQRSEDKVVIKLFPPELGRVQIELLRKDQAIEVRISTENQTVRELILSNSEQLRQNLQNSGVQLRNFEVNIGNFRDFFLNSQQNPHHPAHRERGLLPDYGPVNRSNHLLSENPEMAEKIIMITGRINILI